MPAARTINDDTTFTRTEAREIRLALQHAGFSEHVARRLARTTSTLTGATAVRVADILERAGDDRQNVISALREELGFALVYRLPTGTTIDVDARRPGRPRSVKCCTGPSHTFGSSMNEWPSGACISTDGRYRYSLWRKTSIEQKTAAFILKNPSTADHMANDASTHNCRKSAAKLGLGAELVNIWPHRGDVQSLLAAGEAREGDRELIEEHIRQAVRRAAIASSRFWRLRRRTARAARRR